jgi:hypothetical protein
MNAKDIILLGELLGSGLMGGSSYVPPPMEFKPHAGPKIWADRQPLTPLCKPLYKAGRNQPCPCNSGKKFKACCIDKVQE